MLAQALASHHHTYAFPIPALPPDIAADIESKIKTKLGIGVPKNADGEVSDELAARRPA